MEKKTSRRMLGYFFESKLWKDYLVNVVDNTDYWAIEDLNRAAKMIAAQAAGYKGYTIEDHLLDVVTCVTESNLKPKTKARIYVELDMLEEYHAEKGTLMCEL